MKNEGAIALSPNGELLAVKGKDHGLAVCDVQTGKVLFNRPDITSAGLCNPQFTRDGKYLVDPLDHGVILVWEVSTWREVDRFAMPGYRLQDLTVASDVDVFFAAWQRPWSGQEVNDVRLTRFRAENVSEQEPLLLPSVIAHGDVWSIRHLASDSHGNNLAYEVEERILLGPHDARGGRHLIVVSHLSQGDHSVTLLPVENGRQFSVWGIACGSGGLTAVSMHENLHRKGMTARDYEVVRLQEHTYVYFFRGKGLELMARWYWNSPFSLLITEPSNALVVNSMGEQGAFLADLSFDQNATRHLQSSHRYRGTALG